ncbi:MAG: glycosyltransferase family 9 protein [Gammaproteobacteria bacterium]
MKNILVIKLGALGDFIMAQPAFRAIRQHHAADHLTLLTIRGLADIARMSELFDEIVQDRRDAWPVGHWRIARRLHQAQYDFVFDLQGTARTGWYWRWSWPRRPMWAGPVAGCSHPRPPRPPQAHRVDWYRAQLAALGLSMPDSFGLDWLTADLTPLNIPDRYALLVAGGSAHRPTKRWPAAGFVSVAEALLKHAITPVLIGTQIDSDMNREIAARVPGTLNLTDHTSIPQLASLARGALAALGNDTGPMHVIAAAGAPSVVLFSAASDPVFIGPCGPRVRYLQKRALGELAASEVLAALAERAGIPP